MKDSLQMLLVSAIILLLGTLLYLKLFESESENALKIRSVEGTVLHRNSAGELPAEVGAVLEETDGLLTADGSRVELTMGEHTELTLDGGSSLAVLGGSSDGLRVELEGGRVKAVVRPGGAELAIVTGEREVVAQNASFAVGVGPEGATAVEAREGRVTLIGYGELELLEEGQQVLALAGEEEPIVGGIPKSLLLEVEWPTTTTREGQSRLVGTTQPGAVIWTEVDGKRIRTVADVRGRFQLDRVPLKEGENEILLRGEGLLGEAATVQGSLSRDSMAPIGDFEVQY